MGEMFCSTSLTSSLNSMNTNPEADLHNFKLNISRTLNSNSLLQFNDQISVKKPKSKINLDKSNQRSKRTVRISSTPSIPAKCIATASYTRSDTSKKNEKKVKLKIKVSGW